MLKKILDVQCDTLVLLGIVFALRSIYTKESYIKVNGYAVNTLILLIYNIVLVGILKADRASMRGLAKR